MNDIRPFRGLRYDEAVAGPLGTVVCPPYDVISGVEQVELHGRSPYNVIRLELGLEFPEDNEGSNRYSRAAATLERWLSEGVLKQEPEPAIYLYEQQFPLGGRTMVRRGLMARFRLAPWEQGIVLPHEETMAGPKQDRLQLMRTTACNLSPLFFLFDDPSNEVSRLTSEVASLPPSAEADTGDGQRHRLWVVQGDAMKRVVSALSQPQLYVADGHHRYETALAYRDLMAEMDPTASPDAPYNFAMAMFVDARDPGLVVLPTHRLIRGVAANRLGPLSDALAAAFEYELVESSGNGSELAEAATRRMEELGTDGPVLGYFGPGTVYPALLRPREGTILPNALGRPVLDVDVLQELVLEPLLGIGADELEAGMLVGYTRDAAEAIESVERGGAQAAFLLNPTKVEQVMETARARGRMPQKSTYFYPKPETGMVINRLK